MATRIPALIQLSDPRVAAQLVMTKLAKLEAFQTHVAKKQSRRPEASANNQSMQESHNRLDGLPNWSPDGQPRCFK